MLVYFIFRTVKRVCKDSMFILSHDDTKMKNGKKRTFNCCKKKVYLFCLYNISKRNKRKKKRKEIEDEENRGEKDIEKKNAIFITFFSKYLLCDLFANKKCWFWIYGVLCSLDCCLLIMFAFNIYVCLFSCPFFYLQLYSFSCRKKENFLKITWSKYKAVLQVL